MEIWKPCPGYCFYEVGDLGRVKSLPRKVRIVQARRTYWQKVIGGILSPAICNTGYLQVSLTPDDGGKQHTGVLVHRLVLRAFHGPKLKDTETGHKNGIRTDNKATNLYWANRKQQAEDRRRHGTLLQGETHHATTITNQQMKEIRCRYKSHSRTQGAVALGKEFGVHRTTIENIVSGRTWKD